jgi:hypothetical protein
MTSKVPSFAVSTEEQFRAGYTHWVKDPKVPSLWIPTLNGEVLNVYFPDTDTAYPTKEGAVSAVITHVGKENLPEEWFGEEHTYFDREDNVTPFSVAVKQYVPHRDNPRFIPLPKLKKERSSRAVTGRGFYGVLECDEFLDDTSSSTDTSTLE